MTIGALYTGGYGKRLQSVAGDVPKTLLPLKDDYLILDRQLLDFKYAGINDVYLLSGYKGGLIERRYGQEWNGIKITHLREEQPMGTLWALRNLYSHTNSDVILRNGDTICDLDLREFLSFSLSHRSLMTLVVAKMVSPYGIVSIRNGYVSKFIEKPVLNHYINVGYYHLKPGVRDYLKRRYTGGEVERTLFESLLADHNIRSLKYGGYWKAVDSLKDYEEIRKDYVTREDYDFGHVAVHGKIQECSSHENRTIVIKGKGRLTLIDGKIRVGEVVVPEGGMRSINGTTKVQSAKESRFTLSGNLKIIKSSWK
ncbi:MAG: nucleotidyltransferase family protein [Candidatus Thermoplasmatota archaeon]|jgi:NDP-sugar pyrophosphorylase family protein|nr:nucleotidyltransferase family protein [Candidatus Thermoplasmatota archaeon]